MAGIKEKAVKLIIVNLILLLFCSCVAKIDSSDSSLTSEADRLAKQYWDSGLNKCGEFHYGRTWIRIGLPVADVLFQYKDLEVETKPGKITEADKLNGIEWKGTSYLKPSAHRHYNYKTKKWTVWRNGVPSQPTVYANLIKQRGEWSIGKNVIEDMHYKKINCEDVPE
jgi:hypothetical protein